MQNIRKIKEVDPKSEVNIFNRKPFIYDDHKDNRQNENQGFQEKLDDSIKQLNKECESFDDVIQTVLDDQEEEHVVNSREAQILQVQNARIKYELTHNLRSQHEIDHSFDDKNYGPRLR